MGRPKGTGTARGLGPWRTSFLLKWRTARALTQTQLGQMVDPPMVPSTISRLEDGRLPWRQDQVERLSEALRISAVELLFVDPDDPGAFLRQWLAASPYAQAAIGDLLHYTATSLLEEADDRPPRHIVHEPGQPRGQFRR